MASVQRPGKTCRSAVMCKPLLANRLALTAIDAEQQAAITRGQQTCPEGWTLQSVGASRRGPLPGARQ